MITILEEYRVKPQTKGEIGIEIEMEGHNLSRKCTGWIVTEDGSLRGESAEYVLRAPVPRVSVGKYLERLQEHLREDGSRLEPSERCGVHVHVNCQTLTTDQVINFAVLYLVLEDVLVKWCGEDRVGNLFALGAKYAEYLPDSLRYAKQKGSLLDMQDPSFRYASINLTALSKYGSVEFRSLRTPKDFSLINTWVDMLLKIKDRSLQFEDTRHMIEGISSAGAKLFAQQVLGDCFELVQCPNMDRLIMDGVRRVQDIAYCHVLKNKKIEQRHYGDDHVAAAPAHGPVPPNERWRISHPDIPQQEMTVHPSERCHISQQERMPGNYIAFAGIVYRYHRDWGWEAQLNTPLRDVVLIERLDPVPVPAEEDFEEDEDDLPDVEVEDEEEPSPEEVAPEYNPQRLQARGLVFENYAPRVNLMEAFAQYQRNNDDQVIRDYINAIGMGRQGGGN